jgi:hypothetical protein
VLGGVVNAHIGRIEHAGHAGVDKTGDPAGKDASTGNDVDCGQCHRSSPFIFRV